MSLPVDESIVIAARRECLAESFNQPVDMPLVVDDRRRQDPVQLVFADNRKQVLCRMARSDGGQYRLSDGGVTDNWPATPGVAIHDAFSGLASGGIAGSVTPTAEVVRIVVGDRLVDATVKAGLFLASWEGEALPSVVAAIDDKGHVIAKLGSSDIANWFKTD
jgi:hypothetical protein